LSEAIIDEIDWVLAAHYGSADEELVSIPSSKLLRAGNCDIKRRTGREEKADDSQKDTDQ